MTSFKSDGKVSAAGHCLWVSQCVALASAARVLLKSEIWICNSIWQRLGPNNLRTVFSTRYSFVHKYNITLKVYLAVTVPKVFKTRTQILILTL
jgi:hypothetical protein